MTTRPPAAERDETIVDDLHGTPVPDPYRALEDTDAPDTRAWIEGQNAATEAWLDDAELRQPFRDLLAQRWDWPKLGPPTRRGGRWFQLRNPGMDPQPTLWVADAPDAEGESLLDPASFSDDDTTSLTAMAISDDGSLVAHGISEGGSDWMTWRVRDVAIGEDRVLDDGRVEAIHRGKGAGAAWLPDGSGFLYGRYPGDDDDASLLDTNHDHQLRLHVLGTDPADDVVVMDDQDHPDRGFAPTVTHDGRWLLVEVWEGTQPHTRWTARRLPDADDLDGTVAAGVDWADRSGFAWLFDDRDGARSFAGEVAGELLFLDDGGAPLGQVLGLRAGEGGPDDERGWQRRVVVPEGDDVLERATVVGGRLLVLALHHAVHRLAVVDPDPAEIEAGTAARWVQLPGLGTVEEWSGGHDDADAYLTFTTFLEPPTVLRVRVRDPELVAEPVAVDLDAPKPGLDPERFTTDQVFVEHDGETDLDGPVRVPVFLVRRRDLEPDGETPTVLWGYGGFNVPVTPGVRPGWIAWVEAGGLLAVANLRGGGEYGRAWHDDGRLGNKQHVFDDAIAVAEWLTGTGEATGDGTGPRLVDRDGRALPWDTPWTRPDRLGVEGRSNGGLLVGALMTQRPELWGSCVPEVGVLDLARFHRFTIGWAWTSDYGDPDDPEAVATALAYSPLHNLREGTDYPATMLTTGDHDDRVVPGHSFKFAAALQHAQRDLPVDDERPALVRIDTSAGHGAGKPTAKLIDERADVLAFHARALDAEAILST